LWWALEILTIIIIVNKILLIKARVSIFLFVYFLKLTDDECSTRGQCRVRSVKGIAWRAICGGVNFHVDARGRRIKIERYRIPESCKKKVSMPMWRPQSMDRCLPFERLHQAMLEQHRWKYLLYSMKEKKGWRVGGSSCSPKKGLSKRNPFSYDFRWVANGYVYWVVRHSNCQLQLSMC